MISMTQPNVLIYVMDCLRADRLGCYGYPKAKTPNLDALADDAISFENAYAQSTWTRPSAVSLFSGLYPSATGVVSLRNSIPDEIPWLPEVLRSSGYATACFSVSVQVSEPLGFYRGFDVFIDQMKMKSFGKVSNIHYRIRDDNKEEWRLHLDPDNFRHFVINSDELHQFVQKFLNEQSEPWAIVIWSKDTHYPYFDRKQAQPKPDEIFHYSDIIKMNSSQEMQLLSHLYDSMIAYNDMTIGQLITALRESKLYDGTFLVIIGDHGEAFGEHGDKMHSGIPFEEQIHVPFIIKLPHSQLAAIRRYSIVQLIDLFPTLVDYCGLQKPERLQGTTLRPIIEHDVRPFQAAFSEGNGYVSIRAPRWKFISNNYGLPGGRSYVRHNILRRIYQHVKEQGVASLGSCGLRRVLEFTKPTKNEELLFDLQEDPGETQNIVHHHPKLVSDLASRITTYLKENRILLDSFSQSKLDIEETVADRLRALGYLD